MIQHFDRISDTAIRWCIYAIVFAAPFSKSISEVAIALAVVLWILRKIIKRDYGLAKTELNIPLLLVVITVLFSLFNSAYPALSIKAFFTKMLKYVALYFVIVESFDTRSKIRGLFIIALISMAIIMLDGFFQYYSGFDFLHLPSYPSFKARPVSDGQGFFRGFPTACFPYPNDLAAWILLAILPVACATMFDLGGKRVRYFTGIITAGLSVLFFLTKTRGAWIGLALSVIYIALLKNKMWLILVLILVLAVPFFLKTEMSGYIFSLSSVGDRMNMWTTAFKIYKDHPVIGNGLNTFFVNFKKYRNDEFKDKRGSYAHNCYLQMACDTGALGLAAFLWFVFSYFRSVGTALKNTKDPLFNSVLWGMSIGIFAFLVHSFFDTNLYSLNLVTLFWTAVAISQSIIRVFGREGLGAA